LKFLKKRKKNTMAEIPLHIVELEHDNYHILIEGIFADQSTAFWVIDTGASKTVFDKNLTEHYTVTESDNIDDYQSAGINHEMMETQVGVISSVEFGELKIKDRKVALIDLSHVNQIYEKYTSYKIAGLIGGDILMNYKCIIDYKNRSLHFQES
jgi:hypothetical protein